MIRTVWSSQPTAWKEVNLRQKTGEKNYEVRGALTSLWDFANAHSKHSAAHGLPILVFIQLTFQIELEINEFGGIQGDYDLSLICGGANDALALRRPPFVDAAIG
jgi:hypothetical protein